MNGKIRLIGAGSALWLALAFAPAQAGGGHGHHHPVDDATLKAELGLTDQQLKDFKAERERHREALHVLHEDSRARGRLLHEEHRERLGKILTPQQMEQLRTKRRELMEDRREAREERVRELRAEK